MKYAMVILRDEEEWQPLKPEQLDFELTAGWWAGLKGKVTASARLGSRDQSTTVTWRGEQPVVTDGPYIEAKETVGGVVVVDVDSVQEAIELATTFPNRVGIRIEVRPVLEG